MWSQVPVSYDKHALWGIPHWGRKRQQFYRFAVNRESAQDVYSKRRIIPVTNLQIVEWHNYKHLDWITVRRDDDKLYKFKEGNFNRLHIQDIKDMLLLLVQGKLTNLTVEERLAFNNKDKKNRLMRINELHKFSDDTLNDVRTALGDRLKGIRMNQNRRDLPGYPLDSVEESLEKRRKSENKGKVPTEMELVLEQTQQERLSRSNKVLKLKNFKKDATLKLFKSTNQERYEHVSPEVTRSHGGNIYKMARRDYAWLMISRTLESRYVHEGRTIYPSFYNDLSDDSSSTQADGAQSSRVPIPLPEDPYEAIRKAYLDAMDTESEPFEDPIDTKTPESPLTIAPPTSLPESTPPTLVPILRKTARMAMRVPPAMLLGLLPVWSPPDLLSQKHYRGTSELVEDSDEDDDKEDEEIEESLDSNSVSKDAEDEGPIVEDEDPTTGDEGLAVGDEGPDTNDESHGLDDEIRGLEDEGHSVESDGLGLEEEEEDVPGGQQQAAPIMGTAMSAPLGLRSAPESKRPKRVSASRQPTLTTWTDLEDDMVYIDVPAYPPPTLPIQTPPSPEWMSGSLPISPSPFIIPSPISSPMIPLTVPLPVATPTTAETDGFLTELGAQVEI
ncbi:hypothetical protein Tco_1143682 [Tanacetum coccineum]